MKKIGALFVALCMVLSLLPIQALAEEIDRLKYLPSLANEELVECADKTVEDTVTSEESISTPKLYTVSDRVTYPVIGGNLYFEPSTGTIVMCDSNVTNAVIPNSINGVAVTSIDKFVFSKCGGLTNVTIPDSITSIGSSAFSSCSELMSVTISNNITSIEDFLFSGCAKLKSIIIPNNVTSIGLEAFDGCSGLTNVTISNKLTSIGAYAFRNCIGLKSVAIPSSTTSIGNGAFL